jgi:anti-sigma-K factor RskA
MSEERDIDAAEYVLGTLPAGERARFAERLRHDAELQAAVRELEKRLAPLADTARAEAPSPEVWSAIERATVGASAGGGAAVDAVPAASNVVQLRRSRNAWRGTAIVTGLLAASLAIVAIIDRNAAPEPTAGGRYVAVVNSTGEAPAMIAEVDTHSGTILIRALKTDVPAGHSLELWHIPEGEAPRSLGVLEAGADAKVVRDALAQGPVNGLIAVTVEQEGGSADGKPTSAPIYSGELVPLED